MAKRMIRDLTKAGGAIRVAPDSTATDQTGQPRSGGLDDTGYIMVALLIGIAVSAVWMGTMLPAWRQQATREKEAELIFRGEQYARAIALYFRKNQQLPRDVDILVSQHYLRRKYKDPITGAEFLPIGTGFSQTQAPQQPGRGSTTGRGPTTPGQTSIFQQGQGAQTGIFGVRSTSLETSIKVYQGQTVYSLWPFDYQLALQKMGAPVTPGGGNRGRGRGGPGDELEPIGPGRGRGGTRGEPIIRRGGPGPADGRGRINQPVQGPAGGRGRQ